MSDDWRARARKVPKGHLFEDFALGQVFNHHWGRTLNRTIYPGNTLVARSTVVEKRESQSRPDLGIVTWHTEGFLLEVASQNGGEGALAVDFRRSNLIPKRGTGV